MKRKDRILLVSLLLFNEKGEANISSVDIANELDISPGNLYYHYKGKEEILRILIGQFTGEIGALVEGAEKNKPDLHVQWPFIYLFVESFYRYRCFLRNINDTVLRYPDVGRQLLRTLMLYRDYMTRLLAGLAGNEKIGIIPEQKNLIAKLVKSIMLVMIYSESYQILNARILGENQFVQDVSLQILSLLAPYLSDDQIRELHEIHQAYLRNKTVAALT